ncbi:hypothetical protein HDU76_011293, partial [Blyttiomyces sp. JEL0837]
QLESVVPGDTLNKFCAGTLDYRSIPSKDSAPLLISFPQKDINADDSLTNSVNANGTNTGTIKFIRFPIVDKPLETTAIEFLIKKVLQQHLEILDPTYRQAIKLSASEIATHFHPGSTDIFNTLSRFLCDNVEKHTNVKAVLDKLKVYGPGGFFKSHVDTLRGVGHFRLLVVCLPTSLEGREFVLREPESGVERVVDWSTDEPCSILKWVAFLGSVEHEVLEVKEGYRVTLTYNLYHVDENVDDHGSDSQQPDTTAPTIKMDPTTSVIRAILAKLKDEPDFAPDGCTLGYFCQHKYSTDIKDSSTVGATKPPRLLGCDLAFFNAANSLGWTTKIIPVFDHEPDGWDYEEEDEEEIDMDPISVPPKNQTIWT